MFRKHSWIVIAILSSIVLLALVGVLPKSLSTAHAMSTLTVNTTADTAPPCAPSAFSLRCALAQANADGSGDIITFKIPSQARGCKKAIIQGKTVRVCTITPTSILTPLTASKTLIDGYMQPGAHPNTNAAGASDNAILTIGIDGTKLGQTGIGLLIKGSNNTVRGLALNNFGSLSGQAIEIDNFGSSPIVGNTIEGNFIGVGPDGTVPPGGGTVTGIVLGTPTSNTTIGGTTPAAVNVVNSIFDQGTGTGNVIEGNLVGTDPSGTKAILHAGGIGVAGLHLAIGGTTSSARNVIVGGIGLFSISDITIQGNYIGTDITGTKALGTGTGITVRGSLNIRIGGITSGSGNVISGNAQSGIAISDNSSGITIQGNFIGTDVSGTKGLGNGGSGIVDGGSSSNIIGGTTGSARNVISANRSAGVQLIQPNLDVVEGNYIGTDVTGTKALGNGQDGSAGVFIQLIDPDRPANNTIGGTTSNARNVISGNLADGIDIAWYPPANPPVPVTHDIVEGNFIGTDASGANALGNGGNGVFISHLVRGDQVGGTVTGAGNVIAYNRQSGVLVGASNSDTQVHIAVNQNAMFSNGGLGIDLAPQGAVNCTTPPPGPNDYTPCPVIASASTTQVSGTACAHCMVEVFIATNQQDDLGHGEGQTFLGNVTTNASGAWSLTLSPGQVSVGQFVTATVTTSILPFETSEFATNIIVGA